MAIIFLFAVLFPYFCAASALTLPRAQSTGVFNRPLLKARAQSIVASQRSVDQIYNQLLPQLSLSHHSFLSKELSYDATTHTIALSGSQVLFNPAGPQTQGRIAELSTQQEMLHLISSRNDVRYAVATNFLDAWLLQEKQSYMQALALQTTLLQHKNEMQRRTESISAISWAQTETTLADMRLTCSVYPQALHAAFQKLASSLGIPRAQLATPLSYDADITLPRLKALSYYVKKALAQRPDMKEKKITAEQQGEIARSQRLSYLPTISATGHVSKTFAGTPAEQGNNASIGIRLQWNFFDGFQNIRAAQASEARQLRTLFEKQELINAITTDVTTAYTYIVSAQNTLQSTQAQHCFQKHLMELAEQKRAQKNIDCVAYAKQACALLEAVYAVKSQKITLHSAWQKLAYLCGYPNAKDSYEI